MKWTGNTKAFIISIKCQSDNDKCFTPLEIQILVVNVLVSLLLTPNSSYKNCCWGDRPQDLARAGLSGTNTTPQWKTILMLTNQRQLSVRRGEQSSDAYLNVSCLLSCFVFHAMSVKAENSIYCRNANAARHKDALQKRTIATGQQRSRRCLWTR